MAKIFCGKNCVFALGKNVTLKSNYNYYLFNFLFYLNFFIKCIYSISEEVSIKDRICNIIYGVCYYLWNNLIFNEEIYQWNGWVDWRAKIEQERPNRWYSEVESLLRWNW